MDIKASPQKNGRSCVPSSEALKGNNLDNDALWIIEETASATTTVDGVNFTLSAPNGATLNGNWNKPVYTKFLAAMGERLVGTAISTDEDNGGPITLILDGLSGGNHSLLAWHNSWETGGVNLATVSVSVGGDRLASGVKQSGRVDNLWEAATSYIEFSVSQGQTVEVIFTPGGGDEHIYLNGFELDGPNIQHQIAFPHPENHDEHVELGERGSTQASWRAPFGTSAAKYNVYLGSSADELQSIGEGVTETSIALTGLNFMDVFYWRVDVVLVGQIFPGRVWTFRVAHLAFPGAEGWGRFARGGRGGKVVKVTTLEDSEELGTLRHALTVETGPRTIIFDVGGVITTKSRISGWTIDESFSSRSAYNISFQRNMISEPLNVAGHKNYPAGTAHGYAATIGGDVGSFHHNLIAHAEGRSWSMGGGVDNNARFSGRLDIRNNVVYNFGSRVTDGGAHQVNFVGNYYKPGPASQRTYDLRAQYEDNLPGTQTYHCSGNSMLGRFDQDSVQYPPGDGTSIKEDIACWADVSIDPAPEYQKFFNKEFFKSHVTTQASTEAYKRVLSDCGASQPVLDDHDHRIIQETIQGSYNYSGSVSGKKGLIDSPKDAGGLEDFPEVHRESSWDTDGDGIPDWWDGSTGGEGYTVIEGYLNFMADPHVFVEPSGSASIDMGALAVGFARPTFNVRGAKLGVLKLEGSVAVYEAGKAGVERLEIKIRDNEGSEWTRTFGVGIFAGAPSAA
ncbi:hypothetical protein ACJ41O_012336 [Fusarium nematophilum]